MWSCMIFILEINILNLIFSMKDNLTIMHNLSEILSTTFGRKLYMTISSHSINFFSRQIFLFYKITVLSKNKKNHLSNRSEASGIESFSLMFFFYLSIVLQRSLCKIRKSSVILFNHVQYFNNKKKNFFSSFTENSIFSSQPVPTIAALYFFPRKKES